MDIDEIALVAKIDPEKIEYVSPVHSQTYEDFVEDDNLGGAGGYFIFRERKDQFEVLAKAKCLDSAREIFGMLTSQGQPAS
ncbi:MAG: hypothetical protein AAF360_04700 [Pseudomonadota bacterium]